MWADFFLNLLKAVLKQATPEVAKELVELLDRWEKQAKATPNPFDDLLVMMVRGIIGI